MPTKTTRQMQQSKAKTPTVDDLKKEVAQLLQGIKGSVTEKMIERASDKTGISTWSVKRYLKGEVGYVQRGERIYKALLKEIEKGIAA